MVCLVSGTFEYALFVQYLCAAEIVQSSSVRLYYVLVILHWSSDPTIIIITMTGRVEFYSCDNVL